MKNNTLSNYTIYSGQLLEVPTNTYKVVSGDSLYSITEKYSISMDALRTANDKWNDTIYPGEVLKIPVSSTSVQPIQKQQTSGVISYSKSDVDLLSRLITAEAGGESYNGMLAVGAVVVNRVQSSLFTTNISGVINEQSNGYYQFSPVLDHRINEVASPSATKAAYESLKGTDPTNGALYFFENSITNKWLTSKKVAVIIGNHTFAY
ncbi:cell wall hydrolase [Clostridium sp.]|uniref:cell wall hydrolase n=1 Tax=Clostridium sp. TaxID=1506 RepID=UPI003D6D427E